MTPRALWLFHSLLIPPEGLLVCALQGPAARGGSLAVAFWAVTSWAETPLSLGPGTPGPVAGSDRSVCALRGRFLPVKGVWQEGERSSVFKTERGEQSVSGHHTSCLGDKREVRGRPCLWGEGDRATGRRSRNPTALQSQAQPAPHLACGSAHPAPLGMAIRSAQSGIPAIKEAQGRGSPQTKEVNGGLARRPQRGAQALRSGTVQSEQEARLGPR